MIKTQHAKPEHLHSILLKSEPARSHDFSR